MQTGGIGCQRALVDLASAIFVRIRYKSNLL
jgi:hypothetical protein